MFFKRKSKSTEFNENPNVILGGSFDINSFRIFGHRIGDNISKIDIKSIAETTFHEYPEGITKSTYFKGKVHYELNNETIEYLLQDRIKSVLETDGWLQMEQGYSIRIQEKRIVEFMLGKILPDKIKKISKNKISRQFGTPSVIREEYENMDGSLFNTHYKFEKQNYRLTYDEWNHEISNFNIGEPMAKNKC